MCLFSRVHRRKVGHCGQVFFNIYTVHGIVFNLYNTNFINNLSGNDLTFSKTICFRYIDARKSVPLDFTESSALKNATVRTVVLVIT